MIEHMREELAREILGDYPDGFIYLGLYYKFDSGFVSISEGIKPELKKTVPRLHYKDTEKYRQRLGLHV